jgi:Putative polyhydroxyalkanoic acid system protein (PHA_gran_rgn)
MISLTVQHGRSLEEARRRLETAVHELSNQFATMVRRVEWSADHNRVRLEGPGAWVEIWVDALEVHARGDVSILGGMLTGPLASGLKQIVQRTFQKQLP